MSQPAPPVWIEEYAAIREAMDGPYDVGPHSPHHNAAPKPHVIMDDPLNPLIDEVRYKALVETMAAAMIDMYRARITITDYSLQERGFTQMQLSYVQMDAAARAMPYFDLPVASSPASNGQTASEGLVITSGATDLPKNQNLPVSPAFSATGNPRAGDCSQ